MKKLISTTLAVTMLTVPLISSACFADKAKESNILCAQHKNHFESLKEKKFDSKKAGKILAGVTAGTAALTGVTAAALKLAEDKLPENIKSNLDNKDLDSKIIQSLVKNNTSIANKTNLTAANFTSNNANSFNKLEKSSGNLFNLKEKIPSTEKSLLWSVLFLLLIIQTIVIEPLANKISTAREEILNEYF